MFRSLLTASCVVEGANEPFFSGQLLGSHF
jgi:hypothetical protein